MAKFFRLVGNEWKKQFSKVATWVMIILLIIVTLFSSLTTNLDKLLESAYREEDSWEDALKSAKQSYEAVKNEADIDPEFVHLRKVDVDYYSYLLDNKISSDDWRYSTSYLSNIAVTDYGSLIYTMFSMRSYGAEELADRLFEIVEKKDLKAFYNWMFESILEEADPEEREIYEWAYHYLTEHGIEPSQSDWRYATVNTVMNEKIILLTQERLREAGLSGYSESQYQNAKDQITLELYRLEHNQERNPGASFRVSNADIPEAFRAIVALFDSNGGESPFWNSMVYSVTLLDFVAILCIVIGGSIVSSEFSAGTIKFLLINPAKRWKILMSKYAATLLFGLVATVLVFLLSFLTSILFHGGEDAFQPALSVKNGVVVTGSPYLSLLLRYLSAGVKVVVMTTFAFAMSSLSRSSALSIGISLAISFNASIVMMIMQLAEVDFARYFLFANWDFSAIVNKTTGFVHHSLPLAIVIVVLHMVVFLWTAWDGFVRREV